MSHPVQAYRNPIVAETYITALLNPSNHVDLSFVIPVFNEMESLDELVEGISANIPRGMSHEIIFIDDGSTDRSWQIIQAIADVNINSVCGIKFRSNFGKATALQVGFDVARGDIIFTMDADLQDDPVEIPAFLKKLDEGFDLVSGWKRVRHDPWHKVLPSRIFNRMLSYFSQVKLHDHNCGFKCYRRSVATNIELFGELHRMVPALAGMQGFRVAEIPVTHHARQHGVSKYGFERFIRGFSDMLTVGFLRKYRQRPAHFANLCVALYLLTGGLLIVAGCLIGIASFAGVSAVLTGMVFLGMSGASFLAGLIAELIIRQPSSAPQNSMRILTGHSAELKAPSERSDVRAPSEKTREYVSA